MDNPQMNWMPYVISSPQIKVETSEVNRPLISPPSTPLHPLPPPFTATSSSRRRSSTSSLTGHKRPRPYPSVAPDYLNSSNRRARSDNSMSSNEFAQQGTWSTMRSRSDHTSAGRRSDEGEHTPPYSMPQYMSDYLSMQSEGHHGPALTPPSSSSSLSGAVGGEGSRGSRSPPSNTVYGAHETLASQGMGWTNQQMSSNVNMVSMNNTYSAVTGGFSPNVNGLYDYTTTRHTSPSSDTIPSQSPQAFPQSYDAYGLPRNMNIQHRQSGYNTATPMSASFPQAPEMNMPPVESSSADVEIRRLRRRIQELQLENRRAREALESVRSSAPHSSGLPTPPHSSSFQSGWKARTEARKKLFCSLNRAGNALCAWHDSRRERRAYPPRNAPPGYLNCGCSYEEALFEESLSRHGVGSYHPGETVRMDPALRNPLLALLQKRYGYKDGDFEHDPLTEEWHDGESPALWEQKILTGQAVRRRPDSHSHERR